MAHLHSTSLFFSIFFTFFSITAGAQEKKDNIHYSSKKEYIKVIDKELGYTSTVEYKGEFISEENHIEVIPYSELEEIYNIEPKYYNSKNKLKRLKDYKTLNSSMISSSFYDGYRAYLIDYSDAGSRFEVSYEMKGKELMTLTALELNNTIPTDSFIYHIEVPLAYRLFLRFPEDRSNLTFDSTITNSHILYKVISTPKYKVVVPEISTNIYEFQSKTTNFVRLIVVPKEFALNPWKYFNEWYSILIKKQNAIDQKVFDDFDLQNVIRIKDFDSIPIIIFDYVKSKVAYIDVENGLGAYQPRDPNDVLLKKQGDCKDMSFLLYELLRHYGYDVHLALSSTITNTFKLDFPSMSSADHVICALKEKDKWIYLDATEGQCKYGFPSRAIQGTTLFIIDSVMGQLNQVDIIPAEQNKVATTILLSKKDNGLTGTFSSEYHGLSAREAQTVLSHYNEKDFSDYLNHKFHKLLPAFQFDSVKAKKQKDDVSILINVKNDKSIIHSGSKTFITLKFLIYPHEYPVKLTENASMAPFQTNFNSINCIFSLNQKVKMNAFTPVSFNKNGFEFTFTAIQTAPDQIQITYFYKCNKVVFTKEDLETFVEINTLMTKTLNSAISYE